MKTNTETPTAQAQPDNTPRFRDTSARRRWELMNRLSNLGFSYDEFEALRRIQMTFHRWDEAECGDSNDYASWAIERDEETGIPYRCVYPNNGNSYRRSANQTDKRHTPKTAGSTTTKHENTKRRLTSKQVSLDYSEDLRPNQGR